MDITSEAMSALKQHALREHPNESCGVILDGEYVACTNTAQDPSNDFKIAKDEYLTLYKRGVIQAIVHSHTHGLNRTMEEREIDPRTPSQNDMIGQQTTAIPWGIVSTEGETVTDPVWLGDTMDTPLTQRKFIHGVFDCYCIIRDYYWQNHGAKLPEYPRDYKWWEGAGNLYTDNFEHAGFKQITWDEMREGDVLLVNILCDKPNHAAIYCGENTILHHYQTRLSGYDKLSKWKSRVSYVLRYTGSINT